MFGESCQVVLVDLAQPCSADSGFDCWCRFPTTTIERVDYRPYISVLLAKTTNITIEVVGMVPKEPVESGKFGLVDLRNDTHCSDAL